YGDVNEDGEIDVMDANIVRRYAVKLVDLSEKQMEAADVSGDGKVNVIDANLIRRYVAKLLSEFPVEG
ncbi:MAG: dockerin type I repeat-containing protein, partial [Oscillospiraceae bacterium]|nr:dockerin type I repeat-containing protein [Oscillospiraceae bacterium]